LANTASTEPSDPTWEAVLPRLLEVLERPATADETAAALGVSAALARKWLARAVEEKRIAKSGRPARFQRMAASAEQSSLFGGGSTRT
jgi:predicted ArsR family transcriptional regulator